MSTLLLAHAAVVAGTDWHSLCLLLQFLWINPWKVRYMQQQHLHMACSGSMWHTHSAVIIAHEQVLASNCMYGQPSCKKQCLILLLLQTHLEPAWADWYRSIGPAILYTPASYVMGLLVMPRAEHQ